VLAQQAPVYVVHFTQNDAAQTTQIEYVTNMTTGIQYRWTTTEWVKSYEGLYPTGEWSLVL